MTITTHGLTKKYPLKTALDSVSIQWATGKIHALVGDNGAGKSTLAALVCGDYQPSEGFIAIDGKKVQWASPKEALENGIALVHQRPLLAPALTAKENLIIKTRTLAGELQKHKFFIRNPSKDLLTLKAQWAPELPLNSYVKDLGGNMRFYISLLGSLLRHPDCLILDEPSAFLTMEERKRLYTNLQKLAATGTTVAVITHSQAEALTYPDTISLLHDGKLVQQFMNREDFKQYLSTVQKSNSAEVNMQEKDEPAENKAALTPVSCIRLEHVRATPKNRPVLLNADLEARYGEITCVTGLAEAAIGTLEDVITGMSPTQSRGTVFFTDADGTETKLNLSRGMLTAGFLRNHKTAIVPSDRALRGSNPNITVEQMLTVYEASDTHEKALVLIEKAAVRIQPQEKASALSGGMLQRLVLERELSTDPSLLILCNPMQGLDIQSQGALCKRLTAFAGKGKAVLVIGAADFPLSLCARVYTLESGMTQLSFTTKE